MLSQVDVLRFYGRLHRITAERHGGPDSWKGHIVLSLGLGPAGSALAIAAHIAGAVSLSLEADVSLCRAALRTGACDFLVNSLDEALRVMKNEIRRKQPLSVALHSPVGGTMREIVDRGVRPALFANLSEMLGQDQEDWYVLASAYFATLNVASLPLAYCPPGFDVHTYTFPSPTELRAFDRSAEALLAEDPWRKRWLGAAPTYFHRERPPLRALLVTAQEQQALQSSAPSASLDTTKQAT